MRQRLSLSVLNFSLALALAGAAHAEALITEFSATLNSTTNGKPQAIAATIIKPLGTGPYPGVVIAHDCSGLGPRSSGAPRRWGNFLAGEGYAVIFADSFTPRGFPDGVCTTATAGAGATLRFILPIARAIDEFAALDYLREQPFIDKAHIGLMGGSHGGSTTLATMVDAANPLSPAPRAPGSGFTAAIALYPGCGARYPGWNVEREYGDHGPITRYLGLYKPAAPLLILIGEKDDWTPADQCEALTKAAQAAGYPIAIKVYPGAFHSFDSAFPPRYVAQRRNANAPSGHGATTGGDFAAWEDAKRQVSQFFARYLKD